jgi:hypothetical protein
VLPLDPLGRAFPLTPSTPLCHMQTLAETCIWEKSVPVSIIQPLALIWVTTVKLPFIETSGDLRLVVTRAPLVPQHESIPVHAKIFNRSPLLFVAQRHDWVNEHRTACRYVARQERN